MSNNNKQTPDLTKSLLISDNTQAPSTTTQTVKKPDYVGINLVEMSSVKPSEKNDSLGISGINQPDVTTGNLSHSDEASTSTDETIGILLDCAERGYIRGNPSPPSICKVSRILRDHSKSSFKPLLVSIGPIHRENKKLKEFEWQKECYLNDLLNRSRSRSTPNEILEACLLKVNTLIPQIRESYAGMIENYSDDKLARMMVMDGCFILEFCFKHDEVDKYLPNKMENNRIAMDLMLVENQVPFVVLHALFDCLASYIFENKGSVTLSQVLDTYFVPYGMLFRPLLTEKNSTTDIDSDLSEKNSTIDVDSSDSNYDHVLGYLHKRYQLEASKLVAAMPWNSVDDEILRGHTIVEMDRSGMKFKPHQEYEWSMTIKFQPSLFPCLPWFGSKPTLLMPTMVIDDRTELILRNFIAYEQLHQVHYHFTSYAHAMDMLIDTQEDIAKLVESKVLLNMLVSNKEAADMINKICKNMFVTDFYYAREFKQMNEYYNRKLPMIKRTYFSNPWNAYNLFFGFIAFVATVVSAIVAVLEYFF